MGCHLSKSTELSLRGDSNAPNTVELSSYEADSRRDPNSQRFDTNLSQNMATALSSLAIIIDGNSVSSEEKLQSELQKLQLSKSELEKKIKSFKALRKVSPIILVVVFAFVLISSVVFAAKGMKTMAAALGAATSIPFFGMGKWFDSWMKKEYEDKWERQKAEIISKEAEISAAFNNLRIAIQASTNLSEAGGFNERF